MTRIINIADLINPESGLSYRAENTAKAHTIPLFTLVELKCDPEWPCITDGLRLYVQGHSRDCDGTPLYDLTANYKVIGRNLHVRSAETEEDRMYCHLYSGAIMHSYGESSLEVIKTAAEILALLPDAGYAFDGKIVKMVL